jgi:DNA-binding phage protein
MCYNNRMTDEIRARVKQEIEKRHLMPTVLAEEVGVSYPHLYRMLQGESGSRESWLKLLDAVGLELTVRKKRK